MDRRLLRPDSLDEALGHRQEYGTDGFPIAGGQSLLVMLRNRLIDPQVLIDLERIPELRGVTARSDGLSIGAMTTIYNLTSSPEVQRGAPVLGYAASKIGSTAIRNLGTIGGNLCHNEPGADLPPALLALNATVDLRSAKGTRKLRLDEFFRGYFESHIEANEILCGIEIPKLDQQASAVYLKHAISAEDLAIASVAVVLIPDGIQRNTMREVRIGLGGVAPVPFRAAQAERRLKGVALDDASIREAAETAATQADPISDPHGSAEYRRKMVKVLVRRAISAAMQSAERNGNGKA